MSFWKPPDPRRTLAPALCLAAGALALRAGDLKSFSLNAGAVVSDGPLLSVRLGAPVYVAPAPARSAAPAVPAGVLRWGDVYAFPNPAKDVPPTLHVEAPGADRVSLSFHNAAGEAVHRAELDAPGMIDDGQGAEPAFEYAWGDIGPGVYYVRVTATRNGLGEIRKTVKLAVLR